MPKLTIDIIPTHPVMKMIATPVKCDIIYVLTDITESVNMNQT